MKPGTLVEATYVDKWDKAADVRLGDVGLINVAEHGNPIVFAQMLRIGRSYWLTRDQIKEVTT